MCSNGDDYSVDVQRLPEVAAAHPNLKLASCCDRAAALMLTRCAVWSVLLLVLPVCSMRLAPGLGSWSEVAWWGGAVLLGAVLLLGCRWVLPLAWVNIAPPPAGECMAPLVAKSQNRTHRSQHSRQVQKVLLLSNPNAGKGQAATILGEHIRPLFKSRGVAVQEVATTHVGHARELGYSADLNGVDVVVVLGGDGTLHEVANGLLKRASAGVPPLGIIPFGSGNAVASDFRQNQKLHGSEISVYKDLNATADWGVERILSGKSCCVDVLDVAYATDGRRLTCVSMIYFGFFAEIDLVAEPFRCLGPARFDLVSVWNLMKRQKMPPCRIELVQPSGEKRVLTNDAAGGTQCAWLGFVLGLGQHWSDSIRASPGSRLDDGVAELHIFRADVSTQMLLRGFTLIPNGAHLNDAAMKAAGVVETIPFREIKVAFAPQSTAADALVEQGIFNVDGEIFRHDGVIEAKVVPHGLRIACDPDVECHV